MSDTTFLLLGGIILALIGFPAAVMIVFGYHLILFSVLLVGLSGLVVLMSWALG
jgi:hypothetical protein